MWKVLFALGFTVAVWGQPAPKKAVPDDLASRKSFQELLVAHDQAILAAMKSEHTYACFRPGSDEFLLIVFDGPNSWGWTAKDGSPSVQQQPEMLFFDDYKNGALAPTGVGVSVIGFWERAKGFEEYVSFHGDTKEQGAKDNPDSGSIDIDGSEFSVAETYKNASGGQTTYRFTLRLSTGRFTESYVIAPKFGETSVEDSAGRCSTFIKGKQVTTASSVK
jgi:hypothetical protein